MVMKLSSLIRRISKLSSVQYLSRGGGIFERFRLVKDSKRGHESFDALLGHKSSNKMTIKLFVKLILHHGADRKFNMSDKNGLERRGAGYNRLGENHVFHGEKRG